MLLGSADATSNAPLGTLSFTDECPVHITVRCHVRLPEGKHNYMILYVFFDQTPDGYVCLWFSYGLPMVFLLKPPFSYGFSMVFLLKPPFSYGFPMVFLLKPPFSYGFSNGFPIKTFIFLWFSYGFPIKNSISYVSYGFPMVCLLKPQFSWFSMVFLWFSY